MGCGKGWVEGPQSGCNKKANKPVTGFATNKYICSEHAHTIKNKNDK